MSLDDVLKAIAANPGRGIFVSRSGAEKQKDLAIWIAARLKANGYIPILPDAHFKHADFMLAMDAALASGARVVALLSREYVASQHCMKEALSALDDQRNASGRLVLLNVDDCRPLGLLRYVDRVDFAPVWRAGTPAGWSGCCSRPWRRRPISTPSTSCRRPWTPWTGRWRSWPPPASSPGASSRMLHPIPTCTGWCRTSCAPAWPKQGRAAEIAALATRAVESTFDTSGSVVAHLRNHRWLPQAIEAVRRAPRAGPDAWHTLWTQFQIGDLYVMRGSLGQALAAYEGGRALANDVAKADPGNAGWQRDLPVSHNKIGLWRWRRTTPPSRATWRGPKPGSRGSPPRTTASRPKAVGWGGCCGGGAGEAEAECEDAPWGQTRRV